VVSIVHVGDCRVGRQREGRLAWLTQDHSLISELQKDGALADEIARVGENHATVITRVVGVAEHVAVDLSYHPALPEDIYLLCTDGLTRHVDHARISELAGDAARSLRERCTALLDASEAAGGHDNTTVLLFRLRSGS
jgi:protein phosphatase